MFKKLAQFAFTPLKRQFMWRERNDHYSSTRVERGNIGGLEKDDYPSIGGFVKEDSPAKYVKLLPLFKYGSENTVPLLTGDNTIGQQGASCMKNLFDTTKDPITFEHIEGGAKNSLPIEYVLSVLRNRSAILVGQLNDLREPDEEQKCLQVNNDLDLQQIIQLYKLKTLQQTCNSDLQKSLQLSNELDLQKILEQNSDQDLKKDPDFQKSLQLYKPKTLQLNSDVDLQKSVKLINDLDLRKILQLNNDMKFKNDLILQRSMQLYQPKGMQLSYDLDFHSLQGVSCKYPDLNITLIVQNNTGNVTTKPESESIKTLRTNTDEEVRRYIEFVFDYAVQHCRTKITFGHKSKEFPKCDGKFLEIASDVNSTLYPQIQVEFMEINCMVLNLVMNPHVFDLICTTDRYGAFVASICNAVYYGTAQFSAIEVCDHHAVFKPLQTKLSLTDCRRTLKLQ